MIHTLKKPRLAPSMLVVAIGCLAASTAVGAEPYASYDTFKETAGFAGFTVNNLWVLIAAALVFIMHLGFATLETGLTQSKNTVNILFKNSWIVSIGVLTYFLWGFNAMYPDEFNGIAAMGSIVGSMELNADLSLVTDQYAAYTIWTDFIFQAMFAATAATIVSGAVAERVRLSTFMLFSVLLVMFAYPLAGSWHWGGGWLKGLGFYDFAGSSIVHGFGGFAALACVIVLGPRAGKYLAGGRIRPILGHNMPLATIGVFLLFLGWFGFNGGSVLSADPLLVSYVFVTTALAAVSGAVGSIAASWVLVRKPDLSMALNGFLAGLVGITAGADAVGTHSAVLIGLIAGVLVVFAVLFFDRLKIDDPVGAISVHGVCGIWGTLAVGLFSESASFGIQLLGTAAYCGFAFIFSLIVFTVLKVTMGVRVSAEEEAQGLDIGEHGQEAYPDFQLATHS